MPRPRQRRARAVFATAALAGLLSAIDAPLAAADAWSALAATRAEFERAAWTADFVQTYVPAGFSSGERETGRVALAIPGRLRWDYAVPYPKVFLIRDREAYTWNPGEGSGRRALLEGSDLEHLALLALDMPSLRQRYEAALAARPDGSLEVTLTPRDGALDIRSATLVLDGDSHRILALGYSDLEGNTTRFELSGHKIAAASDLFEPPAGLEWFDD